MSQYLQTSAGVLIGVILALILGKQSKDWALVLTVAVCCMVLSVAAVYLEPVLDFADRLTQQAGLDGDMLGILFKAVGIGLVGEITALICQDSGNAALGKGLQLLASVVVIWISLPMMEALLELVQQILGEL